MRYRHIEKLAAGMDDYRRAARTLVWNDPTRQLGPNPDAVREVGARRAAAQMFGLPTERRLSPEDYNRGPAYNTRHDTLDIHGPQEGPTYRMLSALHESNERRATREIARKMGYPTPAAYDYARLAGDAPHVQAASDVLPNSSHMTPSVPLRDMNIANTAHGQGADELRDLVHGLRGTPNVDQRNVESNLYGSLIGWGMGQQEALGNLAGRAADFGRQVVSNPGEHVGGLLSSIAGGGGGLGGLLGGMFGGGGEAGRIMADARSVYDGALGATREGLARGHEDNPARTELEHIGHALPNARRIMQHAGILPGGQADAAPQYVQHAQQRLADGAPMSPMVRQRLQGIVDQHAHTTAPAQRLNRNELRMIDDEFHRTYNPDIPQLLSRR
jgi:hypothetical protein